MFESTIFRRSNWNYHARKISVSLRGPMTWKVMPRNAWNDIVTWQAGQLNNSTKYQFHAMNTIISKKNNGNPLENVQKYALKLFWHVHIWHVLDDPLFYGQWKNLQDTITKWTQACGKRLSRLILLSPDMWLQTKLLCGKHFQTMWIEIASRLRFCRRSWGFKIYIRRNIVHFGKSYVSSNKLDV